MNLLNFLNITGRTGAAGEEYYFRFLNMWEPGVTALAVILLAAITIYTYRKEPDRMNVWGKVFAVVFRCTAALAFFVILWRPAVTFEKVLQEKQNLVFIVDKSLSMGIADKKEEQTVQTRNERLNKVMSELKEDSSLDEFNVSLYTAGEYLSETSFEEMQNEIPSGKVSRIYEHALDVMKRFRGRPVAGVYLLTDGNMNGGIVNSSNFNIQLREDFSEIPFHIAGVGSSSVLLDIILTGMVAPENVFVNEGIEVICRYEIKGPFPESIRCTLLENGKLVSEKTVQARNKGEIVFTFKPEKPGNSLLSCRIDPLPGETHEKNNERTRVIKVYEGKLKILYVEGGPRWEYRYLKNALLRDKMAELSTLLLSADKGFVQEGEIPINSFPDGKELEKYDVIIIGNADSSFFTETQMDETAEMVEKKGTGIVFIPGNLEIAASYIHTPFENLMPVKILPVERYSVFKDRTVFQPFRPELQDEGWEHPVMQLTDSVEQTKELWGLLPPLFKFLKTGGIKPGKTLIAVHPKGSGIKEPEVIFAGGFYGVGKTFFSAVDSTWRWRFQSGDAYFYRFWLNVFRYVSAGRFSGGREPCLLLTGKQSFDVGEQMPVKVLIRDRNFKPVTASEYRVTVESPDKTREEIILKPAPGRDGYYTGSFFPGKQGMYTLLMDNPEGVRKEYRKINAELPEGEFREILLNAKGIGEAIAGTHGRFFNISAGDSLLKHIRNVKHETREEIIRTDFEIFNHWLLFLMILLGLTGEWVLRKVYRLN